MTKRNGHVPKRNSHTVYLDNHPDVELMVEEAIKTRVFSRFCVEALRDWLIKNGFDSVLKKQKAHH